MDRQKISDVRLGKGGQKGGFCGTRIAKDVVDDVGIEERPSLVHRRTSEDLWVVEPRSGARVIHTSLLVHHTHSESALHSEPTNQRNRLGEPSVPCCERDSLN